MPWTAPQASPSETQGTNGAPAVTRISSRVPGKGWFCPRTSSAVIAPVPLVTIRMSVVVVVTPVVGRRPGYRW
ncbi:hypothetical protein GCM10009654_22440 [Streptomyces hebeiensis]|uniref:Uncharacterized protein n=1 Tax=Streptomyces hebeiensis TaxID=229486 RepID=A0ABN1URV1_9ACTN